MKKNTAVLIALLVLPLLAVAIAVSPASVQVLKGETLYTTTFAEAIVGSTVGWCAPVALLMTYALFAGAVIYGLSKKIFWLKVTRVVSFLAMTLAVLPVLVQAEIMIVPNALVGVALGIDFLVAHLSLKKSGPEKETKPQGKRLAQR